ncbi:hypothetical protein SNOG_07456 [Parastagonospora nodorum SN15]|uniref:Uncharacterized protein n=1 Tax=Phaeosphaeria nodorum (strain SN15 / ATCC MYA-4574 / FGSC 10173) TaxID=321614 RepID=Q0ULA8_PHANO|nr:hypothetical protein SNOG_07456 [Parastagonospora nodorum SN15]EAT84922.1 hypothetical protein SNOG_07456 [Parastagonospora nodorum SN15]
MPAALLSTITSSPAAQNEESTSTVPISDQQRMHTRLCPTFWSTVIVLRKTPWGMHELLRGQCPTGSSSAQEEGVGAIYPNITTRAQNEAISA